MYVTIDMQETAFTNCRLQCAFFWIVSDRVIQFYVIYSTRSVTFSQTLDSVLGTYVAVW